MLLLLYNLHICKYVFRKMIGKMIFSRQGGGLYFYSASPSPFAPIHIGTIGEIKSYFFMNNMNPKRNARFQKRSAQDSRKTEERYIFAF